MDFEWCFGTFVPCFGGQTTKGGQEPAKHGIDHTPDPVAMQWPCLPEHKLRTLRTRSVRRASGLVQTALADFDRGPLGRVVVLSFFEWAQRTAWRVEARSCQGDQIHAARASRAYQASSAGKTLVYRARVRGSSNMWLTFSTQAL